MASALFGQLGNSSNGDLALVGGTIYVSPTAAPIPEGVVLIHGGKIAAVGSRALVKLPQAVPTLDCSGRTITAGFWNSHMHFFERKWANVAAIPTPELSRQLRDMLTRYGFTSVFDLGSPWENTRRLRDRIESGEVPGPGIRSTGEGLVPPGGVPSETVLNMMGVMKTPLPEVADAAQAAAAAKKLLDAGVDAIKLFASAPRGASLPESAMQAAVSEAHRSGKPVFVHPNSAADVLAAVRGGVDIIGHTTPSSGPWDETILQAMTERRVALTPTLTLWKYYMRHDRISTQEQTTNTAIGQLRAWLASGGAVLFGNDLGAVDYDPTEEYVLMAEAGMSFRQILTSLTTAPAERYGESKQLGRIAAGLQADLVVLKDDPSRNMRALAAVEYTLRAGKIVYRAGE
ncbi:MAG TPA: amidohydrolase family protein [Candidatus Acidoferrales bacterium]|nr:amidohydrolase family protein [Candidatus Acidoferrales bacterium]